MLFGVDSAWLYWIVQVGISEGGGFKLSDLGHKFTQQLNSKILVQNLKFYGL